MLFNKVFLLALLLFGCGTPPQDAAEPKSTPDHNDATGSGLLAEETSDARPLIVAFGDSLTAGYGVEPGKSYADFLQQELDRRGHSYHVINEGVSGDTTASGLARVGTVVSRNPRYVIVEFGGNDGLRALPAEQMKANLAEIVERLKDSGATVILAGMRLPPNYGREYTSAFEKVFADLAREFDLPLIPFLLEGVWDNPTRMQSDGIHPNVEGNRKVAQNVLAVLQPVLASSSPAQ